MLKHLQEGGHFAWERGEDDLFSSALWAFFALELAEPILARGAHEFLERAALLRGYLVQRCDQAGVRSLVGVSNDRASTLSGCSLFVGYIGHKAEARDLWEATGSALSFENAGPDALFRHLAHRALAGWGPRQNELSVLALAEHDRSTPDTTRDLILLAANQPGNIFGVDSEPLFAWPVPPLRREAGLHGAEGPLRTRLANRFLDLLFQVLATEPSPERFDAISKAFFQVQRVFSQVLEPSSAGAFTEDPTFALEHWISRGLCYENHLVRFASVSLEDYLGVDCATTQAMTARLLLARKERPDGGTWPSKAVTEYEPFALHRMVRALLDDEGPRSRTKSAVLALGMERLGGFGVDPAFHRFSQGEKLADGRSLTLAKIRTWMRRRMRDVVAHTLRRASDGSTGGVDFELVGFDEVNALNPGSPQYWKRSALEFRVALDEEFRGDVRFTLQGIPVRRPGHPLEAAEAKNVQSLRRMVNELADGWLWGLARDAPFDNRVSWVMAVHRALRTGIFFETDFEALILALGISEKTREAYRSKFVFASPDDLRLPKVWYAPMFLRRLELGPESQTSLALLALTEFSKQLGAREALKLGLTEIVSVLAWATSSALMSEDEIDALLDQLFLDEARNVVVVPADVPFVVPPGYEFLGVESLPAYVINSRDIYAWSLEAVSHHPPQWEEQMSLALIDPLMMGESPSVRKDAAQKLRSFWQEKVPQNVILRKTWEGVEVYRKGRFTFSVSPPSMGGTVIELGPDPSDARVVHTHPGPWHNWYHEARIANDIPEVDREAYRRALDWWLLTVLLEDPAAPDWNRWRARVRTEGLGSFSSNGGSDIRGTGSRPESVNPNKDGTDADGSLVSSPLGPNKPPNEKTPGHPNKSFLVDAARIRELQGTAFEIRFDPSVIENEPLLQGLPLDQSRMLTDDVLEVLKERFLALWSEGAINKKGDRKSGKNVYEVAFGPSITIGKQATFADNGSLGMISLEQRNGKPELRFSFIQKPRTPLIPVVPHASKEPIAEPTYETLRAPVQKPTLPLVLEKFGPHFRIDDPRTQKKLRSTFGEGWTVRLSIEGHPHSVPELQYHLESRHNGAWKRRIIPVNQMNMFPPHAIRSDGTVDLAFFIGDLGDKNSVIEVFEGHALGPHYRWELETLNVADPKALDGTVALVDYVRPDNPKEHFSFSDLHFFEYLDEPNAEPPLPDSRPVTGHLMNGVEAHIKEVHERIEKAYETPPHPHDARPRHRRHHAEDLAEDVLWILETVEDSAPFSVSEWDFLSAQLAAAYANETLQYRYDEFGRRMPLMTASKRTSAWKLSSWVGEYGVGDDPDAFDEYEAWVMVQSVLATEPSYEDGKHTLPKLGEDPPVVALALALALANEGAMRPSPWLQERTNEAFVEDNLDILDALTTSPHPPSTDELAWYKARVLAWYDVTLSRLESREEQTPHEIELFINSEARKAVKKLFKFRAAKRQILSAKKTLEQLPPEKVLTEVGFPPWSPSK